MSLRPSWHGTRGGRNGKRRYMCSARHYATPCGEPMIQAERLEDLLVE